MNETSMADSDPPLPWLERRLARWLAVRRARLRRIGDAANRMLGVMCLLTRSGPATPQPRLYQLLRQIGVLEHDTRSAAVAAQLERLPWGKRAVSAPPPPRPLDIPRGHMWPQAPIVHPDLYPAVLHLQPSENEEHIRVNALRYLGQIVSLTPRAAWRALTRPRVWPVDDMTFARILTETSLAQHLRHTLGATDQASFARQLTAQGCETQRFARIDFSGVQPGPTLPHVNLAPSVTLFRRGADGRYDVVAIRVRETVFTPDDGAAWELARYQVLSGAHVQHTVIVHPRLHFPGDVINAVTKSVLPRDHLLARLIVPHTRVTLGLDRAVTHHRRSVLYNSQREIYTPLPLETEGICAAVRLGRLGLADNDSYPAYDFWGREHDPDTRFGRYCQDWQDAFERFACEATRRIDVADTHVVRWADAIQAWVPGFPDGRAIFEGDCLGRAVGRYLATVTVLHSADHHSYAAIPIEYLPMRVRLPSPDVEAPRKLDLTALISPEDFFRHVLCHRMFFQPVVVESLDEVRYDFTDDDTRRAVQRFRAAWAGLDARWAHAGFPLSYEIASSVQY